MKAVSSQGPDLNNKFIMNNGITIPLGKIVNYKANDYNNNYNCVGSPEYIVYDNSQIRIRYIIQIDSNGDNY